MSDSDAGFLSRWSRRKALVRQGVEPPEPSEAPATPPAPLASAPVPAVPGPVPAPSPQGVQPAISEAPVSSVRSGATEGVAVPARPAPPTMQDVQSLTSSSDFSRFVARDVDPQVKNAAMKKLFADPHFNVMDGLDTYIDDYHTPDPLPKAMMRQLVQARMLGLLDDEMPEQPAAQADRDVPAAASSDVGAQVREGVEGGESTTTAGDGRPVDAGPASVGLSSGADPSAAGGRDPTETAASSPGSAG